jgi:prepilin-type N-terminal cleavage/methylation domain-containing protein
MMKTKRGFTLIELLVVIAIIGILASVVLAGVSSQRQRAQDVSALQSARSAVPVAIICHDDSKDLNQPVAIPTATTPQVAICLGSESWPKLPTGWSWGTLTNPTAENWQFVATGNGNTITCNVNGCTRS